MSSERAGPSPEYTILDYVGIARKRWRWIILPLVLFVGLGSFLSLRQPDRYQATARVLLADTAAQRTLDPSSQNTGFLSRELSNEISLAYSDTVEELVEDELGELPAMDITSESQADVLVFDAVAPTADEAALNANTWARMYVEVKRDDAFRNITSASDGLLERLDAIRVEREELREPLDDLDRRIGRSFNPDTIARLQQEYDRLEDELRHELALLTSRADAVVSSLTQLQLQAELSAVGEARIIEIASPPESTSNAPLSRDLILPILFGLVAGVGLAFFAEVRDNTIRSSADIQALTDLPVLASIPAASKRSRSELAVASFRDPEGVYADGYHKVRSSLEFVSFDSELKSVLVTSPNPSEGKSTTSSNLALAMSSVGRRTVLLDVDFRRPMVHQIYKVEQSPGLSDSILSGVDMHSVAYSFNEPGLEDLLVVPTGSIPPNPAAFVGTSGFLKTIDWMEDQADVIILDAPPLLAVSDAHTLGKHVDAVILTAMAGQTTKGELAEVIAVLRQVGANLVGVVLLGVDETEAYGKGYYYKAERRPEEERRRLANGLWGEWKNRRVINLSESEEPVSVNG